MKETDDHFSADQMAALKRRNLPLTWPRWRRVNVMLERPISIPDDGGIIPPIDRSPKCPILDSDDMGDLIVLPDGQELWVQG